VGHDPLSVSMMAVLVLFSVTLRGKQPLVATGIVAAFFQGRSCRRALSCDALAGRLRQDGYTASNARLPLL
jgi:hypothetical protein